MSVLSVSIVSPILACVALCPPTSVATAEFDELCFDFGIELDEDVSFHNIPQYQSNPLLDHR